MDLHLRELFRQRADVECFRDGLQHLLCNSSRPVLISKGSQPVRVESLTDSLQLSAKRMPPHHNRDLIRIFGHDRFPLRRNLHRHAVAAVSLHKDKIIVLAQIPEDCGRQRRQLPCRLKNPGQIRLSLLFPQKSLLPAFLIRQGRPAPSGALRSPDMRSRHKQRRFSFAKIPGGFLLQETCFSTGADRCDYIGHIRQLLPCAELLGNPDLISVSLVRLQKGRPASITRETGRPFFFSLRLSAHIPHRACIQNSRRKFCLISISLRSPASEITLLRKRRRMRLHLPQTFLRIPGKPCTSQPRRQQPRGRNRNRSPQAG